MATTLAPPPPADMGSPYWLGHRHSRPRHCPPRIPENPPIAKPPRYLLPYSSVLPGYPRIAGRIAGTHQLRRQTRTGAQSGIRLVPPQSGCDRSARDASGGSRPPSASPYPPAARVVTRDLSRGHHPSQLPPPNPQTRSIHPGKGNPHTHRTSPHVEYTLPDARPGAIRWSTRRNPRLHRCTTVSQ